jgi:hypothetical protein
MSQVQTEQSGSSPTAAPKGFTAHLEFFDQDDDQQISLRETLNGLERIGIGRLIAIPATAMIHLGVSGLGLVRGNLQNPLHLSLSRVGVLRHPDVAFVDRRHAFDASRLEEAFAQYGKQNTGDALTLSESLEMVGARLFQKTKATELLLLPSGVVGAALEWGALLWLAGEWRDGKLVLTKQAARAFYTDPSFFNVVARRLELVRRERATSAAGKVRNLVQTWLG